MFPLIWEFRTPKKIAPPTLRIAALEGPPLDPGATSGKMPPGGRAMPHIVDWKSYGGFERRVNQLGPAPALDELRELITGFRLSLDERKHGNAAVTIRETLDGRFKSSNWTIIKSGEINWTRRFKRDGFEVYLGVELQFSPRGGLLNIDLGPLVRAIELGDIDAGVVVVPCDWTAYYLTARCPRYSCALDHVERTRAQFSPLLLVSIAHDGIGVTDVIADPVKTG
jgi:hypothetical protein